MDCSERRFQKLRIGIFHKMHEMDLIHRGMVHLYWQWEYDMGSTYRIIINDTHCDPSGFHSVEASSDHPD